MDHHYWIQAGSRRSRSELRSSIGLAPVLAEIDGHRHLRGPYTVAGSLLRAIGAHALALCPELGPRHHIEILTCAPEFEGIVPPVGSALEANAAPDEIVRYKARLHTLRVAHGLVDFLSDYLDAAGGHPASLIIENVHEADPTDHEFLAVLLRRMAPARLTIVIGTDGRPIADPPGPAAVSLKETLAECATTVRGADEELPPAAAVVVESEVDSLAQAYVDSDGTSDDPRHLAAYERLSADRRAELHDQRALVLAAVDQPSLRLGAIPYHAERGSDPAGAGAAALRRAQLRCKDLGFYHATAELGLRGRRIVERLSDLWWRFTGDMTTSLAASGRGEETAAFYDEARAITTDPVMHMHAAYGTAMLYARHYPDDRRDFYQARIWLNVAIAIASLLEDPKARAFHTVFNQNGLALVEVREGRMAEALRLLNNGMERLDRELDSGEHTPHRIGLLYNRAQVHGATGDVEAALADYTAVIGLDPDLHDHYFNRGNILRKLGRIEDALADYASVLRLSPPFPEVFYNRGDALLELGDVDGALADFGRAIELDQDHVDSRLNRASILCDRGMYDAAWQDVSAGLAVSPSHGHLLCLKGRLLAESGAVEAAREALSAALDADAGLSEAWAIRGELAFLADDLDGALDDLNHAVACLGSAEMRFNRAVVLEAAGRFADAADDYTAVLDQVDDADARQRRDLCRQAAAERAAAA